MRGNNVVDIQTEVYRQSTEQYILKEGFIWNREWVQGMIGMQGKHVETKIEDRTSMRSKSILGPNAQ